MIYIDITSTLRADFLSGIQRTVMEIVSCLHKSSANITLLKYQNDGYFPVDAQKLVTLYNSKSMDFSAVNKEKTIKREKLITITELERGGVFLEIDAVWDSIPERGFLYRALRDQGLKIVVLIYDVIPFTHPEFVSYANVARFLCFFYASLIHADTMLAISNYVKSTVNELCRDIDIIPPPISTITLGADLDNLLHFDSSNPISTSKYGQYILMVGTIDQRKNHPYVLDAFDDRLFELGLSLVIAGRRGAYPPAFWSRLEKHPELGNQLFIVEKPSDAELRDLYLGAWVTAFTTIEEGFGLPLVESFALGVPCVASDIAVLHEIGGEYGIYCDNTKPEEFVKAIEKLLTDKNYYDDIKQKIKMFVPTTWKECGKQIEKIVSVLETKQCSITPKIPKQMVILTARTNDILSSLPYIEYFMPFIKEVLLCCPDRIVEDFSENYIGTLAVSFLTDKELLGDKELPADHGARNFLLRCLAIRHPMVDDVFIMSDDDYRPLTKISPDVFVENGRYNAYRFDEIKHFLGTSREKASYDFLHINTLEFLKENDLPTDQYSAHQPQIIDKRIYNELLDKFPGIENTALDEWSTYFNYAVRNYGIIFERKNYLTACWPNTFSIGVNYPQNIFLFENYYKENYESGGVFYGLSREFNEMTERENFKKIEIMFVKQRKYIETYAMYEGYASVYEYQTQHAPAFVADFTNLHQSILSTPQYICLKTFGEIMNIPVYVCGADRKYSVKLSFYCTTVNGAIIREGYSVDVAIDAKTDCFDFPIEAWNLHGKYILNFEMYTKENHSYCKRQLPVYYNLDP